MARRSEPEPPLASRLGVLWPRRRESRLSTTPATILAQQGKVRNDGPTAA